MSAIACTRFGQELLGLKNDLGNFIDYVDPFNDLEDVFSSGNREKVFIYHKPALPSENLRELRKYRVVINMFGFHSDHIRVNVKKNGVFIFAKRKITPDVQRKKNYLKLEFSRLVPIPEHIERNNILIYLTANAQLIIEMPFNENETQKMRTNISCPSKKSSFYDRFVGLILRNQHLTESQNNGNSSQLIKVCIDMDKFNSDELNVYASRQNIVVKAQHTPKQNDKLKSSYSYFRSIKMPNWLDLKNLSWQLKADKLEVSIPVLKT